MTVGAAVPCRLSARERDLLVALCHRVKVLSLDQLRRGWWGSPACDRAMRRRLAELERNGWLLRKILLAKPVVQDCRPLAVWAPGSDYPGFVAVSSAARRRWSGSVRAQAVVTATPAAARRLGGVARRSRPSEATHDLHLAEVFLHFRATRREDAASWVGEGMLEHNAGVKVPDAVVRRPGQSLAVEVCGESYTPERLRRFHEHCARKGYGYELW